MIKKISIFIFSFLVFACYGQKKLSFDEFSSLNDSLDNQISLFFTLFLDSYELAYLEYPSDFDDFIEFSIFRNRDFGIKIEFFEE